MWEELGISGGTAIIILMAFYFVIKWAVKNGICEAYRDITSNKIYKEKEDKVIELWEIEEKQKSKKNKK